MSSRITKGKVAMEGLESALHLKYPPKGARGVKSHMQQQHVMAGKKLEDDYADAIDMKYALIETFKDIWPLFQNHLRSGDVSKLLQSSAPFAVMTLISEMMTCDKSREKIDAAKTLSYMAGYQPVQRNLNIEGNIDRMTDDQVTGLLKAAFNGMSAEERKTIQQALEQKQLLPAKGDE